MRSGAPVWSYSTNRAGTGRPWSVTCTTSVVVGCGCLDEESSPQLASSRRTHSRLTTRSLALPLEDGGGLGGIAVSVVEVERRQDVTGGLDSRLREQKHAA